MIAFAAPNVAQSEWPIFCGFRNAELTRPRFLQKLSELIVEAGYARIFFIVLILGSSRQIYSAKMRRRNAHIASRYDATLTDAMTTASRPAW